MTKYLYHVKYMPNMVTPTYMYNIYDRSQAMLYQPEIECISPLGKVVDTPKSIEELCYGSVQRILSAAKDKELYITWSGGIDSSLVLSEFLKYADHKRITVICDRHSFAEYPEFFKNYINKKLKTIPMNFYNDRPLKQAITNGVVITGHLLDPVFGSNSYSSIPKEKLQESLDSFLRLLNYTSKDMYKKLSDACPVPITNVKELFWWMDYCLNYQNEELMWLLEIPEMRLDQNLFHFGSGEDWNNYAVSTPIEIKWPGYDFRKFKQVLKDHLFKFTKDEHYTLEKIKLPSWRHYRTNDQRNRLKARWIDTEWRRG